LNALLIELRLGTDGTIAAIYDDALLPLIAQGNAVTTRASHVEPHPTKSGLWTADMAPVDGPVLGPFPSRAAALAAEREYIHRHAL
jgi:hypothetical protein